MSATMTEQTTRADIYISTKLMTPDKKASEPSSISLPSPVSHRARGVYRRTSAKAKQVKEGLVIETPSSSSSSSAKHFGGSDVSNSGSRGQCNDGVVSSNSNISHLGMLMKTYRYLVLEYPWATNTVQSAIINMISVIISQKIKSKGRQETNFEIKWIDIFCMMFISITYSTPLLLKFYRYMKDWTLGGDIGKVLFSQFVFFPLFNMGFIAYRFFLLGQKDIIKSVATIFPMAQGYSWTFWIPQTFIAIKFVPHHYHVLFGSLCAFFWNIIFVLALASKSGSSSHK